MSVGCLNVDLLLSYGFYGVVINKPQVALHVFKSHALEQLDVLPHLFVILALGFSEFEVDDNGLRLADHDAVGAVLPYLPLIIDRQYRTFVEQRPIV